ncbi:carotenoid oxygenase family protein [Pseudomonas sp. N040]|uniref:carotenoid oxygenase family protein n=1 Tax=Pseudomonas sp. N040 TaxID=2785325 RepID=UPI0018A255C3|nr:carotenoid oxygenase family protein [Pseudomonas sp. N040]MBF7728868.1 carotenoid oxygenase family protein [Pseudomonas sp. N040]MBW7012508.1 carotenoid oxygenase family protein [Pseudomonas sp. N040]
MNSIAPEANPYLLGSYAPITEEIEAPLEVLAGAIPADLAGVYVRNGPNPQRATEGRHHWFDGDGMLHAVEIANGHAIYRNRWIETAGLQLERSTGEAQWQGIREPVRKLTLGRPYKDTANTDVKFHNGALLALWYQCGEPYRVDPVSLQTLGVDDFAGKRTTAVSAHVKVDARTGEMMFFEYSVRPPYLHYGVVSAAGEQLSLIPVELPGPRLPHDMAITEHYSILMDLPVCVDTEALQRGRWRSVYRPELGSRFAIIPRHGTAADVRWFSAAPCYIYHVVNSWEEGDEVVMLAHKVTSPVANSEDSTASEFERMLQNLQMNAELWEWRFNLQTGQTSERCLDQVNAEFPSINPRDQGYPTRYGYAVTIGPRPTLRFDGIRKYDLATGKHQQVRFGQGIYGSESPFAPGTQAQNEDDGYLLSFVQDEVNNRSELWIYDARDLQAGPCTRLAIPQRVPLGFHACWVEGRDLKPQGSA